MLGRLVGDDCCGGRRRGELDVSEGKREDGWEWVLRDRGPTLDLVVKINGERHNSHRHVS